MKKLILFIALLAPLLAVSNNFEINIADIDAVIENAQEVGFNDFQVQQPSDLANFSSTNENYQFTDKNATTAFVLGLFLGTLGVHRLYLGTSMGVFIVCIITQAGCGVLYFVDNLLLLMALLENGPIDVYVDNPHFFMWMK